MTNDCSGENRQQPDPASRETIPEPGATAPTAPLPPYAVPEAPTAPIQPYAGPPTPQQPPYAGPAMPIQPYPGAPAQPQPPHAASQQPYGPPAGYAAPYGPPKAVNGLAVSGFVVGLVSVFLPLIFGFIGGAVGLTLSSVGVVKHDPMTQSSKGVGIAGIVLSAIAIVFIL